MSRIDSALPDLPKNLDAERQVLGAILLDNRAMTNVAQIIRAEDFFLLANTTIYREMEALYANQTPIELTTLIDSLRRSKKLESVVDVSYVSSLTDGMPKVTNVAHYARIVRREARRRTLYNFAEIFQDHILEAQQESPEALGEEAISELLAIIGSSAAPTGPRAWQEVARSAVRLLREANQNPQSAQRIMFGLRDLDEFTGGFRRKELVVVVAPTSNGKTLLASQLSHQAARDGCQVLYFSAEMPGEQLAEREIAFQADVKFYYIQRPEKLTENELVHMEVVAERAESIKIVDQEVSPARVIALAEVCKRVDGLDLVVLDYDQLIVEAGVSPDGNEDSIFRHQRQFILAAKQLAERLDVCIVLLAQLRKVPKKVQDGARPHLDDLWGDSSVRNTPHWILWLEREYFTHGLNKKYERLAKVYVLKARNGRTGQVDLTFDPDRVRFLDSAKLDHNVPQDDSSIGIAPRNQKQAENDSSNKTRDDFAGA
jgi:replicative DNA helicase